MTRSVLTCNVTCIDATCCYVNNLVKQCQQVQVHPGQPDPKLLAPEGTHRVGNGIESVLFFLQASRTDDDCSGVLR